MKIPGRSNITCNITNSSESNNGDKEVTKETKSDARFLEVKPLAGNESDARKNGVETEYRMNSTKVVLSSTTPVTRETIPTTPAIISTKDTADNSTVVRKANDDSAVKESAKGFIVATDGSSVAVIDVTKDSNFTKNEINR